MAADMEGNRQLRGHNHGVSFGRIGKPAMAVKPMLKATLFSKRREWQINNEERQKRSQDEHESEMPEMRGRNHAGRAEMRALRGVPEVEESAAKGGGERRDGVVGRHDCPASAAAAAGIIAKRGAGGRSAFLSAVQTSNQNWGDDVSRLRRCIALGIVPSGSPPAGCPSSFGIRFHCKRIQENRWNCGHEVFTVLLHVLQSHDRGGDPYRIDCVYWCVFHF